MYIDRDSKPKKKVKFKIDSVLAIIEDASDWEKFDLKLNWICVESRIWIHKTNVEINIRSAMCCSAFGALWGARTG